MTMRVTMVKKIMADGSPCKKCREVEERIAAEGLAQRIDRVVVADERDPESEGLRLADKHQVKHAPFFIVEDHGQAPRIYVSWLQFVREVLRRETDEQASAEELLRNHDDLGML